MHINNIKLPTGYHSIEVESESTQITIPDALNDPFVDENVSMKDLGPIVLACPDPCVVQECSLCTVYKPV